MMIVNEKYEHYFKHLSSHLRKKTITKHFTGLQTTIDVPLVDNSQNDEYRMDCQPSEKHRKK